MYINYSAVSMHVSGSSLVHIFWPIYISRKLGFCRAEFGVAGIEALNGLHRGQVKVTSVNRVKAVLWMTGVTVTMRASCHALTGSD